MNHQVVSKFFNTVVVVVAHNHILEGLLVDLAHEYGMDIVGITDVSNSVMVLDGYTLSSTALVDINSIDVIRPLTSEAE